MTVYIPNKTLNDLNELKQDTQNHFEQLYTKPFWATNVQMLQCTCDFFMKRCTCGQWNICVYVDDIWVFKYKWAHWWYLIVQMYITNLICVYMNYCICECVVYVDSENFVYIVSI